MHFTAAVEDLFARAVRPLPLLRKNFPPPFTHLKAADAQRLFPHGRDRLAALAGLALQLGNWDGAHEIAQDISTREGSYWHAIIHRLEPDYANANYWYRKVGSHAIYPDLLTGARLILKDEPIDGWSLPHTWKPEQFS